MKLITGIVTVALIAASVKVSSAGCGQCAADLKDAPHDHAESVEVDHQHADQITQCAIEMFSELGTDRVSLLAKAAGGCATSATALMQDEIKSLEAMLAAMDNKESRRILRLGMILQEWKSYPTPDNVKTDQTVGDEMVEAHSSDENFETTLDDIRQQLEVQLAQYRVTAAGTNVEN